MIRRNKVYVSAFIALFVTISLNMSMSSYLTFYESIQSDGIASLIMFFLFCFIIPKVLQIREKRLIICVSVVSFLLSSFQVIGFSIDTYTSLVAVIGDGTAIIKNIFKFFGYFIAFYSLIILLFNYLNNRVKKDREKDFVFFTNNKRSFFIVMAIILLAWLPYFLIYFPGNVTPDSIDQILQATGYWTVNNHHPVFHTFFIMLAMNIGRAIQNYHLGVAIYSFSQMIVMAAIFSYCVYFMAKKKVALNFRVITLMFFALYPVHAIYSITMWKDIPFGVFMLLFTICLTKIVTDTDSFLSSKENILLFILLTVSMLLLRNNALHALIIALPFVLYLNKKYLKKLVTIFLVIFITHWIITGPIYSSMNIRSGSIREALSIPMQQFARVVRDKYQYLSDSDLEKIHRFLPVENLGQLYNPRLSDPVKDHFSDEAFNENRLEFIGMWGRLFFRFPGVYVESFLSNSYGYWFPETRYWVVARGIFHDDILQLEQTSIIDGELFRRIDSQIDERSIAVVELLFSIGFIFWIILVMFVYIVYKRRHDLMVIYIPLLALWFTTLAGPVHAEYRYLYALVTCLPLLIVIAVDLTKDSKVVESKTVKKKRSKKK